MLFLQQLRAHPERRRYGYLLFPLLSVLEINLHAAMWPMLLIFLLPYFFESTLGRLAFFSARFDSTRAIPWRTLAVYAALIPKNVIPAEWSAGLQAMREDAAAQGIDIGNVYAVREIGSYLTFAQIPVYHYSCDEAFTGKMNRRRDILAEYHAVQEQQLPYEEFLRRYDFHYLFVKNDDYLYDALASDENYTLLYEYDVPQIDCSICVYRSDLWNDRSVGK